mgnify:CR=1 FL=1
MNYKYSVNKYDTCFVCRAHRHDTIQLVDTEDNPKFICMSCVRKQELKEYVIVGLAAIILIPTIIILTLLVKLI